MGTALQARGLPAGALPESWLLARPEEVAAVHRAHAVAGARLLLTCTFNAASGRAAALLAGSGLRRTCTAAVALARRESRGGLVAGALGPLALARPGGAAPPDDELSRPFGAAVRALVDAGADLLWLESQYDAREAAAALRATRSAGLPVVVTFTLQLRRERLLAADGTPAESLLLAAVAGGAAAVGVNCVPAGPWLTALAGWARATLPVAFVVKPSPGLPGQVLAPDRFAATVAPAVTAGAGLVGGCCGATAGHVAALAGLLGAADQPGVPRG
jgi:5-methyltetrahydrofolate--homocysteine methyltransferase